MDVTTFGRHQTNIRLLPTITPRSLRSGCGRVKDAALVQAGRIWLANPNLFLRFGLGSLRPIGKLDPRLRHFEQKGLAGRVVCLLGYPQAISRMLILFGCRQLASPTMRLIHMLTLDFENRSNRSGSPEPLPRNCVNHCQHPNPKYPPAPPGFLKNPVTPRGVFLVTRSDGQVVTARPWWTA